MSFSPAQIRKLQRDVKTSDIRTREVNGRELSYIEGWHAIAEANRIFGFDAWSRETVETRCIQSREIRGTYHVLYTAKVRLTVRTDGEPVIREGFGTGEAQAPSPGEAHDKAIKTAETDATKRAFATFGKPFGLSLYLGHRKRARKNSPAPDIQRRRTLQRLAPNGRYYVVPRPKQPVDPTLGGDSGALQNGLGTTLINARSSVEIQQHEAEALDQDDPRPNSADKTITEQTKNHHAAITNDDGPEFLDVPKQALDSAANPAEHPAALMLIDRPRRRRDKDHLKYVASQPCLVCGRTPSDAHHLKFAQPAALSMKVSDELTVPLCRTHHRQLHHAGREVEWWIDMDIDPLPIANDLWRESKNTKVTRANGK